MLAVVVLDGRATGILKDLCQDVLHVDWYIAVGKSLDSADTDTNRCEGGVIRKNGIKESGGGIRTQKWCPSHRR